MIANFYIISLYHTMKREKWVTLWRPNNGGYCFSKEQAGLYPEPQKGYHDSERNVPILIERADSLFIKGKHDGMDRMMIPNCAAVWEVLGVKMTKSGLVKK